MHARFSHSFHIVKSDIDLHEHVNNVAYLRWIQDVAVAHWQSAAGPKLQETFTWFVLRHEIDYKKAAFQGEEITAETWVGKATKIKCERFTEISRGEDILVAAKSVWCLLDRKTKKPVRINEDVRAVLEQ